MEIHIQLITGRQYSFAMKKEVDSAGFFGTLKFWDVFDEKVLRITNGENSWTLNPRFIEKMHFDPPIRTDFWSPENVVFTRSISEQSYHLKLDSMKGRRDPRGALSPSGEVAEGVAELTLASGGVEYLELLIMLRPPREQLMDLTLIFQRPPFPILCEDGGFVLLNPINISMVRMYPAMIEACESDWPMDLVPGPSPVARGGSGVDLTEFKTG